MDKRDYWQYCNYKIHSFLNPSNLFSFFCHTCKVRLCTKCLKIHNSNFSSHKVEEVKNEKQKLSIKLEEIDNDNVGININEGDKNNFANNIIINFTGKLDKLDNIFQSIVQEKNEKLNEYKTKKIVVEQKLENPKIKINLEEECKNVKNNYEEFIIKKQASKDLFDSLENLLNNQTFQQNQNSKFNICSNVNNIDISIKQKIKNININFNKNEELNIQNNKKPKNIYKDQDSKEFQKLNDLSFSQILAKKEIFLNENDGVKGQKKKTKLITNSIPVTVKIESKINSNKEKIFKKEEYNPQMDFPKNHISNFQKSTNYNQSIYVNKKIKREREKNKEYNINKEPKFSFYGENKKTKFEVTDDSKIHNNTNEGMIMSFSNSFLNLFNIILNKEGETSISLIKIIGNQTFYEHFPSEQINHKVPFLYSNKFPFLCSRLININNKAFVIGGISFLETDKCGNKFVFRLDYINKQTSKGDIYSVPLRDTLYVHQSHHLIYSELYNFLFVISGKDQTKCEYGIFDKGKEIIKEWKEIDSVKKAKENSICFLLNQKYIFLFGEKTEHDYYTYHENDYEVFDITSIFEDKFGKWKTLMFSTNKDNEAIFRIKIPGIIEEDNNIYILGGYGFGLGRNLNWKISFSDNDEKNENNHKIISSMKTLKIKALNDNGDILSFYGQQKFIKYQDEFHNINIQGRYMKFNKNDFDANF